MLKPTCNIAVECAQGTATEIAHEISNCFNFIAPVTMLKGSTDRTRLFLNVVLRHHPYWLSDQQGADETWEQVVLPWLQLKLRTIQNTIEAYGNKKVQRGQEVVPWHAVVLHMEPYTVEVEMRDNRLPEDAVSRLEALRSSLNAGNAPFDEAGHAFLPYEGRGL